MASNSFLKTSSLGAETVVFERLLQWFTTQPEKNYSQCQVLTDGLNSFFECLHQSMSMFWEIDKWIGGGGKSCELSWYIISISALCHPYISVDNFSSCNFSSLDLSLILDTAFAVLLCTPSRSCMASLYPGGAMQIPKSRALSWLQ